MVRQLRLEFPGSIWHITSRGNEQRDIVLDDVDRCLLLDLLGKAVERFRWILYEYALMTNHHHLVVELTEETLSDGMKWFNGTYAQAFNRRHNRVGHLFQDRFDGRLIEKETYLLEVLRYVVLNPVRAGMVSRPEDHEWTSYRSTAGLCSPPPWLAVDQTLGCFAPEPGIARALYKRFVDDGIGLDRCPWDDVVGQIYLGSEAWVEKMQAEIESKPRSDVHPMEQKHPARPTMTAIISVVASVLSINEAVIRYGRGGRARMLCAWLGCHEGRVRLRSIAASLRIRSTGRVSKLISSCEKELGADTEFQKLADRCVATLRAV